MKKESIAENLDCRTARRGCRTAKMDCRTEQD